MTTLVAPTALTISRTALRTALSKLLSVVDTTKRALPVAQHVLLSASDGRLTLSATNFSTFVRVSLPCEVTDDTSALLPARLLSDIIAGLPPSGAVTLTITEGRTVLTAGRSRFEIAGLSVDDFPIFPDVSTEGHFTVLASPFLDAITRAVAHASSETSRLHFNVALLDMEADALVVVGCQGSSLARLPAGPISGKLRPCSIHRLDVPILARLFGGLADDATLTLSTNGDQFRVEAEHAVAQVRLVDDPFPNYRQIIAKDTTHRVVCDRVELLSAIKRVSLAAGHGHRISITLDAEIGLSAEGAEKGTGSDVVSAELCDGTPITFDANASLAALALDTFSSERIEVTASAPDRAVFFRPADHTVDDPMLAMIMPLVRH